jgi:hypothetical protein
MPPWMSCANWLQTNVVNMAKARFSLVAFVVAVGFWFYQFTTQDEWNFGLQFRYLTIWGLTFAMGAHYLLWRARANQSDAIWHTFITGTAVLNVMVMFLYWRLYFIDPKLVNGENVPVWFQEYYLHLVGPLLIIIDAIFGARSFTKPLSGAIGTLAICLAYIAWSEILVGPLNDSPVGRVTSGLPYPFLNDLDVLGRSQFYLTTLGTALVFYGLCYGLCFLTRRMAR